MTTDALSTPAPATVAGSARRLATMEATPTASEMSGGPRPRTDAAGTAGARDLAVVVRLSLDDPALTAAVTGRRAARGAGGGGLAGAAGADLVAGQPMGPPRLPAIVAADPLLGVLGGVAPACGHLHLAWRALSARSTPDGIAVTVLRRSRPRRVDVIPTGGIGWSTDTCRIHRSPILLPRPG